MDSRQTGGLTSSRLSSLHFREELVDARLDPQLAVHALSFLPRRKELKRITGTLIGDLAEDELQEFPKRLWLLETLIAGYVVFSPTEGKRSVSLVAARRLAEVGR
jgi:hypothetical protein